MAEKAVNTEKYQGPGKILSTISGAASGLVPAVWAGPLAANLSRSRILGFVTMIGLPAIGAYLGYRGAAKGKAQFEALKAEAGTHEARADALETQVSGLTQEVATTRKSFAELHAKHEQHLSHAAQHPSRADHGSHAAAALNENNAAEHVR